MRKRNGFWAAKLMIVLAVLGIGVSAQAQCDHPVKFYPTLSVNNRIYPDGRILVPAPAPGGDRYFLVPVFIYNEVDPAFNPNCDGQRLEPIRSFEFQLEYYNQAMELDQNPEHGPAVVTVGPSLDAASAPALAKNFYITYTDQPDPGTPGDTTKAFNPFRRRIRIAAASEIPLPLAMQSDTAQNVLVYLRFKVIPSATQAGLLQLDTSRFNDHWGDWHINPETFVRGNFGGYEQKDLRGRGFVEVTPQPAIELRPLSLISTEDNRNFILLPDLVYDPSVPAAQLPERSLQVRNGQSGSRLTNVSVVTDQPWLGVSTNPGGGAPSIFYNRIDYTQSSGSEERDLWISANPAGLQPGIYYGYVTLTSEGASNSPTRILVKFIYRRAPDEPGTGGGTNTGIRMSLTNSCSQPCTSNIVFGVGSGASPAIDPLFGETIFTGDDKTASDTNVVGNARCYAYFEPLDRSVDIQYNDPNVLGTVRDIRSNINPGTQLYKVVFSAGDPACYPVTVCVNPSDFPAGARIIARDILNGSQFTVNLREGTQSGDLRCFVIRDTRINSFIIEYTPGTIGTVPSVIANGWNLLSLPVIPPDGDAELIFPDAAGTPFEYTAAAAWVPREELEFGHGYMVRFGDVIRDQNTNIAGVVSNNVRNVRMFRGWNTIGASSVPSSVDGIFFTPLEGSSDVPVQESDVFEYVTGRGYRQVAYLIPGRGYFVKTSRDGYYNLDPVGAPPVVIKATASDIASKLSKLEVSDNAKNAQELFFGNISTTENASRFELPPTVHGLDARFNSNRGYIAFNENSYVVNIKTKSYPVALNFESLQGEVEVRDMNGNVLGTATSGGKVVIKDAKVQQVEVTYKGGSNGRVNNMGFGLEQSSPNPFTASTQISFSLPSEMPVTMVVRNQLGQVVRTLVDGLAKAGVNEVTFDGSDLSAGTYYYTITAGSFTKTEKVVLNK